MDEKTRRELGASYAHILPEGETPCIWMIAGVLTCWLCDRDLACNTCPLDAALRHDSERSVCPAKKRVAKPSEACEGPPAKRIVPEQPQPDASEGPRLEGLFARALPELHSEGMYARDHMCVLPYGEGRVRVGLDPFATRVVGRLRCVVLAPVGTRLRRGHPCAWLDLPGGTLTLLAPISGQVLECNEALARRADFELHDPQGAEWLLTLQPFRMRTESRELMDAAAFAPMVQQDFDVWQGELRQALRDDTTLQGQTLADGGRSVRRLDELLGQRGVHRLASRLLSAHAAGRPKDGKGR